MIQIERQVLKKFSGASLRATLRTRVSLSELFHENTKLTALTSRAYGAWIAQIGRSRTLTRLMSQAYKVYTLGEQVALDKTPPLNEIEEVIAARRSRRRYSGEAVSLQTLARLLFYAYGLTDPRQPPNRHYRAVASGGALYPLELYAVALRVDSLDPGIYHYNVERHALDVVARVDRLEAFKECVWFEDIQIDDAAVLFFITAVFERSTLKYKDRGYRMVLMEAGEAAQNLALVAESLGFGACLVGGFHDDTVSKLLEIDGSDEAPLLPIVVGKPAV
jgi:SagB-type dehydrogenase family enzyme